MPARSARPPLTVAPRETSERVELAADRDPLDRLASATGGKVFTPEAAAEIPALLKSKVKTTTRTEETPLWDHPAACSSSWRSWGRSGC